MREDKLLVFNKSFQEGMLIGCNAVLYRDIHISSSQTSSGTERSSEEHG